MNKALSYICFIYNIKFQIEWMKFLCNNSFHKNFIYFVPFNIPFMKIIAYSKSLKKLIHINSYSKFINNDQINKNYKTIDLFNGYNE